MKAALVLALVCSAAATPSQGGESCFLGRPLCRVLADLAGQVDLVAREVERRTIYIGRIADLEERLAVHEKRHTAASEGGKPGEGGLKEANQEIRQLKERLDSQEALYKDLLKAVEEIQKKEILPFDSNTEDNVPGNSNGNDGLSLLLTKVERVENVTSEVQEELESERRVRRHLEEELNATRHDVQMLNDKFEMVAIVNRTLFKDRNETRESDEDKVRSLHLEEELEYLRAIVTDLRENSTVALTLGASRVSDLEERVTELANASKWMDATMRRDVQNIQTQIGALAQAQLDERLTQSEIRNLTFEVLDQRMALINENLAIAEHRIDFLETATRHKLKEVCSLPKAPGRCRNFTVKWFFDIPYGGCSRFWYSGCDGNGNKFDTPEDCENVCVKPEGPEACFLPKTVGSCNDKIPSWYYDVGSESCQAFTYGGCLGNNNRFAAKEACEQKCINLQPKPARILPVPNVIEGKIGEPAGLPCNAIGWPKPTVTWWREKNMLPLASRRYELLPNYALLIRSVVDEDAGGYSCHAHNGIGSGSQFNVTLIIDIQAPFPSAAPEDTSCIDHLQFSNCEFIVQTRDCKSKFYAKYCCASCTKAGQLQSSAPQE